MEKIEKTFTEVMAESKTVVDYVTTVAECILKNQVKIYKMDKKKLEVIKQKNDNNNVKIAEELKVESDEEEEEDAKEAGLGSEVSLDAPPKKRGWFKSMFSKEQ